MNFPIPLTKMSKCVSPLPLDGLFHASVPGFGLSTSILAFFRSNDMPVRDYDDESRGVLFFEVSGAEQAEALAACIGRFRKEHQRCMILWASTSPIPYSTACRFLSAGAADVIPWEKEDLSVLKRIRYRLERIQAINRILDTPKVRARCLGEAPAWRGALERIVEFARYSQAPILLLGESGTGKELAATLVHDLDCRSHKEEFVVLDCSALSPDLAGSEFFGHEKGAFTNAIANRDGAFCMAHLGTLFLDEVGELPLPLQAELLRVIQEGRYKRLGSNTWQKSDFQLVSATNRDLEADKDQFKFRQDLFYRIAGAIVHLPPLRERREDIPLLAGHFLAEALRTQEPPILDPYLLTWLLTRDYPGNIRELRQLMFRLAARYPGGGVLSLGDLPESEIPRQEQLIEPLGQAEVQKALRIALQNGLGLKELKQRFAGLAMHLAVELSQGNLQQAARLLQVSDRLLQGWKAGKGVGE